MTRHDSGYSLFTTTISSEHVGYDVSFGSV